ncbi:MAG: glycosyltransferase [Acidobacteriota bacterium]|nr:glycosyltransferase [Acidobacteriota bacterium]
MRAEPADGATADTFEIPDSRGKRIVLTTFGSYGDLHPYIAIGLELKGRGHNPVIASIPVYREKVEATGLSFHPVRPDLPTPEEDREIVAKIMDVKRGGEFLFKDLIAPHIKESYEDLLEGARGADLLVTHVITYAGHILAQKTGIPWISTVLAPATFFSAYDPFVPPQAPGLVKLLRLSPFFGRVFVSVAKRMSESWIAPVYKLRAELDLPRGAHPIFEGQYSPHLNLALFSKYLGEPQRDWPPNTKVTGFPFYDKKDETNIPAELEKFLGEGPPPIVFTLGSSAVYVAEDFYRVSIKAARQLKCRAVLLIGDERNRPKETLPEGIVAFDYAPYSQILPRAAAIVHQGGVGTTGQALRSGHPTLVVPFNHDQPDNAYRVERLGVSRTLRRSQYRPANVARELNRLLTDESYALKAAEIGRKVRSENGAANAADEIEAFIKSDRQKQSK